MVIMTILVGFGGPLGHGIRAIKDLVFLLQHVECVGARFLEWRQCWVDLSREYDEED